MMGIHVESIRENKKLTRISAAAWSICYIWPPANSRALVKRLTGMTEETRATYKGINLLFLLAVPTR